jgi:hypothetical protein
MLFCASMAASLRLIFLDPPAYGSLQWRPGETLSFAGIDRDLVLGKLSPVQGRFRVDLVNGETMTPLERLFAVADCANGIGSKLDITNWTFLNTDLAVHVFRIPDGDWIGIRAETSYGPDGIGTTIGTLFDRQGAIGAIQQSVLVRRRPG